MASATTSSRARRSAKHRAARRTSAPVFRSLAQASVVAAALTLASTAQAQTTTLWSKTYTNSQETVIATAVDFGGGVYVAGTSSGATGQDFRVVKYNSLGAVQWVKRYNGPVNGADVATAFTIDGQGNSYITGSSQNTAIQSPDNLDYVTVKYDINGVQKWVARYAYDANGLAATGAAYYTSETPTAIKVTAAGAVYVTGYSHRNTGSFFGYTNDIATVKYNASGVQQWATRYQGLANADAKPAGLVLNAAGDAFVTGTVATVGNTQGGFITYKMAAADGLTAWVTPYNGVGAGASAAFGIALDPQGNPVVAGTSPDSGTGNDFYTVKYAGMGGDEIWSARFSGSAFTVNNDTVKGLAVDPQGNVFVAGQSVTDAATVPIALVKYNSAGRELWNIRPTDKRYMDVSALVLDLQGNAYLQGTQMQTYPDSFPSNREVYALKLNREGKELWKADYTRGSSTVSALTYGSPALFVDASGKVYSNGTTSAAEVQTVKLQQPILATEVAVGNDNKSRMLFQRSDGKYDLWLVGVNGATKELQTTFAPASGYTARGIAVGADNKTRVLTDRADGSVKIDVINAATTAVEATYTFSAPAGDIPGAPSPYRARFISGDAANKTWLVWEREDDSRTAVWRIDAAGVLVGGKIFGPYNALRPLGFSVSRGDNKPRMAWYDSTFNRLVLWRMNTLGTAVESGVYRATPYDYTFAGFDAASPTDNISLLWRRSDNVLAVWRMNPAMTAVEYGKIYGPLSNVAARKIAVGAADGKTRVLFQFDDAHTAIWRVGLTGIIEAAGQYGPY